MGLYVQGGKMVIRDGKVGTAQACCCPCAGSCNEENPCPDGCYCCGGQCQSQPCTSVVCLCQRVPIWNVTFYQEYDNVGDAASGAYEQYLLQYAAIEYAQQNGFECVDGTNFTFRFDEDTGKWFAAAYPLLASCCGAVNGDVCERSEVWENPLCQETNDPCNTNDQWTIEGPNNFCSRCVPNATCATADCTNPLP